MIEIKKGNLFFDGDGYIYETKSKLDAYLLVLKVDSMSEIDMIRLDFKMYINDIDMWCNISEVNNNVVENMYRVIKSVGVYAIPLIVLRYVERIKINVTCYQNNIVKNNYNDNIFIYVSNVW